MSSRDTRSAFRGLAQAGILLVLTVLAAGVLAAACGGDSSGSASSPAVPDKFAGFWAPVDATLEITWGDSKSYGISMANGSSGGLIVDHPGGNTYSVMVVGKDDARSDVLPATVTGDVLSFDFPVLESMPTKVTLTVAADGSAKVAFGEGGSDWDFKHVDALTTKSK